ncbi:hypothetical protein HD554DRAFT_2189854 [Boletus coccyginus]|nr:hypothetical protein HD554DRAFT_2189854 [Boletus coccyginus]
MYSRFVAVFCLFFALVSALPSLDLALRQVASLTVPTALASPTSVTTTSTVQTANGTMIVTCVVTFTPIGQQIQEVQNCTAAMANSSQLSTTLLATSPTASTSPSAAAAFVMPGTSIQVLPVGLGVFGGITAIAIFFVAFVTWERVQHRKAFRQQRMAESNLSRYYGGQGATKG